MEFLESFSGRRVTFVCILLIIGLACVTSKTWAETGSTHPTAIGPAERDAAIRRVLEERASKASPLARATTAMHRSLVVTEELARAATQEGRMLRADSDVVRALILEGHNLRVAYDAVRSSLAEGRAPAVVQRRTALRPRRGRSETPTGARRQTVASPPAKRQAFGHVERLLELHQQLERAMTAGGRGGSTSLLREIQSEAAQSLQGIRPDSLRLSGLVYGPAPEIRREPLTIDPE